ncbi:MAG TPA: EAL domain-containing protein [Steroidobacteraceae bacterium]|nr:EAL domain-containing protein [Steroidobacteraceae bacterium]
MTTPSPAAAIRILVVDDDTEVLAAYRRVLSPATQATTRSALDELRKRLFLTAGAAALPSARADAPVFETVYCSGAEAAVAEVGSACAEDRPFAMVFLDMRMPPGPDGAWAAERIRAIDPEVEIVVCTAFSDIDPVEIGARVPPADQLFYLQKPFHPHEVRQLAVALGERRSRARRRILEFEDFDALTGLPTRSRFLRHLEQSIEEAVRTAHTLAVLYVDLDNFRRINDALGHVAGDALLRRASHLIRDTLRRDATLGENYGPPCSEDDVARLNGDQFIVLLRHLRESQVAGAVAQRLTHLSVAPAEASALPVSLTASVGVALAEGDADAEALLRQSSIAMYAAKRRGRGEVAFYNDTMSTGAQTRFGLEARLQGALERGEFDLHYQPQFDLATGRVAGMEALLRWTAPGLGRVSPEEFIPLAEETGLILPIGEWALRRACQQLRAWHDDDLQAGRVAVNVSPVQFMNPAICATVAAVLREVGLPPHLLELEITESLVMKDFEHTKRVLTDLRALGVSVAIDDFGVGYSNLRRLSEFPVSRLKIDRSLVQDIESLGRSATIVTAIVSMARALGLDVVAEGVENFDQLLQLRDRNCNEVQGFLLSRALPAMEAEALLRRIADSAAMSRTMRLRSLAG